MAKYTAKNKDKKPVAVIQPDRNGTIEDTPVLVAYNKASKRYTLKIDGEFNLSDSYQGCIFRAEQHEVVWEESQA
jgi:hypothetical protein